MVPNPQLKHALDDVAPTDGWYLPDAQLMHESCPAEDWNRPAAHAAHGPRPVVEYVPPVQYDGVGC